MDSIILHLQHVDRSNYIYREIRRIREYNHIGDHCALLSGPMCAVSVHGVEMTKFRPTLLLKIFKNYI